MGLRLAAVCAAAAIAITQTAHSSETLERGPVTNLPLPRFVSLKAGMAHVRGGPGLTHRKDWELRHRGMPLEITAEYEHWRRVRDSDGAGGWIHYSLLSGRRTVVVVSEEAGMHIGRGDATPVIARLRQGVIARIRNCAADWCRLSVERHKGWVRREHLWGVRKDEIID